MPRHESKLVGSGITSQTVLIDVLDGQDDTAQILAWFRSTDFSTNEPWGQFAQMIAGARRRFDEINAELANCNLLERKVAFRERDTEAWYVRQIVKTARFVELEIECGRYWLAVTGAMQIGELFAELRLKQWDTDATFGATTRSRLSQGGRNGRRRTVQFRRAAVSIM
jgi:hypothetical protein